MSTPVMLRCTSCQKDYGQAPDGWYPPICGSCSGAIKPFVPEMTSTEWRDHVTGRGFGLGLVIAVVYLCVPSRAYFFVAAGWSLWALIVDQWKWRAKARAERETLVIGFLAVLWPMLLAEPLGDWLSGKMACEGLCKANGASGSLVDGQCLCEKETCTVERFRPSLLREETNVR